MSKATKKASTPKRRDPKILQLVQNPGETMAQTVGRFASDPAVNAGSVMQSFGNHLGDDISHMTMIGAIQSTTQRIKGGDLSDLEAMLTAQATALQTLFTNLARRAHAQQHRRNFEAFLGLALKAQTQSRATITALVDLKYPRQVAFVKQTNISNGQQQVNNGPTAIAAERSAQVRARAEKKQIPEIKQLEMSDGQWLDARAEDTAVRSHPNMETVEKGDRAEEP